MIIYFIFNTVTFLENVADNDIVESKDDGGKTNCF